MSLRVIAAVSGIYDILLGVSLLALRPVLMTVFGLPAPVPPIHADLNGLFALAIGVGYVMPWRDPDRYRGYLWLMGPALKGAGAVWFVVDVLGRGSPLSFLLFAVTDGTLAAWTFVALTRSPRPSAGSPSSS